MRAADSPAVTARSLPATPDTLRPGRLLRIGIVIAMAVMIAAGVGSAVRAVGTDPGRPDIVDFHELYLAGRLALAGHLDRAYDPDAMAALQKALGGRDVFLPFGYPPPFAFVLAPLALLPIGPAFALFDVATLALFLGVLRRLSGPWFWTALAATSPPILVSLKIGQNGLLTAGLAGLSVAALLERRPAASGLAAGALAAIKPHLALALPLLFLLRRAPQALVVAVIGAAALWGLAVVAFGAGSATGFVGSLGFASRFMAAGAFPLHRMASIYATARSLGTGASVALVLQGASALSALAIATWLAWRGRDPRLAAGLLAMATAFVSPYLYDYDLTLFGLGLSLVLPALASRTSPGRLVALLAAIAVAEALGLLETALMGIVPMPAIALIGPALLACFAVVAAVLATTDRPGTATAAVDAA